MTCNMADKETGLSKIGRLIGNQANIRNIATSAHIHHGKCISGKSRVMLTDGRVKSAKEIFEEIAVNGTVKEENEDHTVFSPSNKVEIFSLNRSTGKLEKRPIQHAWRLRGGNVIKIKLRNGFDIETTPEHKYIVYREGFADVQAKDLKLGDRVVCARKLEINSEFDMKREILERLVKKNFYVNLKEDFAKELKENIANFGIKNIKTDIKLRSFHEGVRKNRYNIKDLIGIAKIFGI